MLLHYKYDDRGLVLTWCLELSDVEKKAVGEEVQPARCVFTARRKAEPALEDLFILMWIINKLSLLSPLLPFG